LRVLVSIFAASSPPERFWLPIAHPADWRLPIGGF
jgi:hypothetical protein